ncbi:MAG: AMP-binding protein, partial [Gammaproteobacteria bacterium]
PDTGSFWRVIEEHKVASLFTAPTAIRAIKKEDPEALELNKYKLNGLKSLFLAGERTDPNTIEWAQEHLNVPVIDHWWQTETGWAICTNCMGIEFLPIKPGSTGRPSPGMNVEVLNSEGFPVSENELGALAVKLPLPPGSFLTLWQAEERCRTAYFEEFPGYYSTSDAGIIDEDGYVHVMSRTDDVINVAGHRLSTGLLEEVLASHPDIAECAVLGVADSLKGQVPLGLLVLKTGVTREANDLVADVVAMVRKNIGPVAAFKMATVIARLPKTRSGKILRGTIRKMADGETFKPPATIDDIGILDEVAKALSDLGYPRTE